jgi:drug/metabolite transporter (DMT)-like permease
MTYVYIKNKILYWSPRILTILFGVFLIVFGGIDDSPGAQLIGLILVIASIINVIKGKK